MLKQIFDPILSKLGELIVACAHTNLSSDIKLILKTVQKDLKLLSAKASDVEEEIKNAEQSGRKKRKREVEEWLVDVKSIESEVAALVNEVEPAGFIRRMMGVGKATRLIEELRKLVDQSRHFGELLLDVRCTTREALAATRSQVEHKSSLGQKSHIIAKTTILPSSIVPSIDVKRIHSLPIKFYSSDFVSGFVSKSVSVPCFGRGPFRPIV